MFGSNVLEVGVGIALLFLFVSLICTSFQEGLEAIFKSRASDLEHGIRLLLGDQEGKGTAKTFFDHPLIYSLFRGDYDPSKLARNRKGTLAMPRAARSGLPSYIPAANFSAALIDLVATGKFSGEAGSEGAAAKALPGDLEGWRKAASAIGNRQIRDAVRSAFELGGGDVDAARANLETWYNGTMDRVSGWYKRRAQRSLFLVGLFIAVGLNIDAITIVRELSVNADLRKAALIVAEKTVPAPSAGAAPEATPQAPTSDQSAAPAEGATQVQTQPPAEQGATAGPEAASNTAQNATEPDTETGASGSPPTDSVLSGDYEMALNAIRDIGYPVGWAPAPQIRACNDGKEYDDLLGKCRGWPLAISIASALAGWIATALAVMLGAPFWFDVLNKFMVIRSTVKSYEKSSPEGSEDRRPAQPAVAAPRARGMP